MLYPSNSNGKAFFYGYKRRPRLIEGSVLICLLGVVICLCINASGLSFGPLLRDGLFDRAIIRTDIGRTGKRLGPLRPIVAYIEHEFTEFVPLERISKQVAVTDVTVSDKQFFSIEYCLNVVIRKLLPPEAVKFWQGVGFSRFDHLLFQNDAATGVIGVDRNFRQVFASKNDSPRSKECRRLTVILNHHLDIGKLEYSGHTRRTCIPKSKLFHHQSWNRDTAGNVSTDFGGIGAFLSSFDSLFQEVRLYRKDNDAAHGSDYADDGSYQVSTIERVFSGIVGG